MSDESKVVAPDDYDLGDGQTLHVFTSGNVVTGYQLWACMAYDHGPMCRRCQEVDGILNDLLHNVLDGMMTCRQDPNTAVFQFQVTEAGKARVRHMIDPQGDDA